MIPRRPFSFAFSTRRCTVVLGTVAWLLFGSSRQADALIFSVGPAAFGCTHADLASALAAASANPGADEVRLLSNTNHQGQFVLFTGLLALRGGFETCTASAPTGMSTLLGDNSNRALFLLASGNVALERLNITGGSVTGDGGGILLQGTGEVTLVRTLVFGNQATGRGGNVAINGSSGLLLRIDSDSVITAGDATDGGGISCSGAALVSLSSRTVVANNAATSRGGGVFLSAGCALQSSAGGSGNGGIVANTAGGDGGGAYIESGAELNTFLAVDGLAAILANQATRGGGVFVTGAGSTLRAYHARVSLNQATGSERHRGRKRRSRFRADHRRRGWRRPRTRAHQPLPTTAAALLARFSRRLRASGRLRHEPLPGALRRPAERLRHSSAVDRGHPTRQPRGRKLSPHLRLAGH